MKRKLIVQFKNGERLTIHDYDTDFEKVSSEYVGYKDLKGGCYSVKADQILYLMVCDDEDYNYGKETEE
jgi:hypothetical protein